MLRPRPNHGAAYASWKVILLGAPAGLRVSELAGLRRADIHLQGEHLQLMVTGKRQKRQGCSPEPVTAAGPPGLAGEDTAIA
ncbi:hypothetical protein GCM10010840_29870 [Deinococcus aerolatus]|uniref:Tyr recombinase domain-containing protein n=1 Tax=Deinococcus aerolatus TaxID=522487 RepID=A0ABQ2GEJ3_9DEIO|nr:site-specific integrase [Deinococcus aerolatus]GGL89849.1 hypothetical protein GCM10010840_29870 [Deinococcus aerolatus]